MLKVLPYRFKEHPVLKDPCADWLTSIKLMCNDQKLYNKRLVDDGCLRIRSKQRLNRVMNDPVFEYPNYPKISEKADEEGSNQVG